MEPNLETNPAGVPGPLVDNGAENLDGCRALDDLTWTGALKGVDIDALEFGTRLLVRTRHSAYRITVLNGPDGDVLIEGGNLLHGVTPARLNGSTAGGTALKLGWIGVGFRMELSVGGVRFSTSPVRSVEIEEADAAKAFTGHTQ